jgi:phenylalanyl-tRNA synthetase beta chain
VSLGTHDLATVTGPFTYTAEPPGDIVFVPLTEETKAWSGGALMNHYATAPECKHLAP